MTRKPEWPEKSGQAGEKEVRIGRKEVPPPKSLPGPCQDRTNTDYFCYSISLQGPKEDSQQEE